MQTYSELAQAWAIDKPTLERARTALGDNLTQGIDYQRGENNSLLWLDSGAEKLRSHLQSRGQLPLDVAVEQTEPTDLDAIVNAVADNIAGEIIDAVSRRLPRRIYAGIYDRLAASMIRPLQPISEAVQMIAGKS
jgi:hypothetical protein